MCVSNSWCPQIRQFYGIATKSILHERSLFLLFSSHFTLTLLTLNTDFSIIYLLLSIKLQKNKRRTVNVHEQQELL